MRIGLFGFPQTGKSTLFRLLTGTEAPAHGGRNEAQVGVTKVPDPRLDKLTEMYDPKRKVEATIEYLDLAGMGKGEAADVLPLDQLRTVDALAHVVRGFNNDAVPHSEGDVAPARDAATMETELILADHTIAERRVEKLEPMVMKANKDEDKKELELMRKVLAQLEQDIPLRNVEFTDQEQARLRGYTFLSMKPMLVVVNADESDAGKLDEGPGAFGLEEFAGKPHTGVTALSAQIETEIAQLDEEDAASFREDLGIKEPALARMIRASYELLGRISFFTVGEDECRAWTVRRSTIARKAAGAIHSDIEKGFIRAEVVAYEKLIEAGSWAAAKEHGTLRLEGKEYVVQDGDIAHFRFNV
jgi:GTP-binding protein YchF